MKGMKIMWNTTRKQIVILTMITVLLIIIGALVNVFLNQESDYKAEFIGFEPINNHGGILLSLHYADPTIDPVVIYNDGTVYQSDEHHISRVLDEYYLSLLLYDVWDISTNANLIETQDCLECFASMMIYDDVANDYKFVHFLNDNESTAPQPEFVILSAIYNYLKFAT